MDMFLDFTTKAQFIKGKTKKLHLIKINFFSVKDLVRMKKQAKDQEKIFANRMYDRGLVSMIEKEPQNSAVQQTNT